MGTSGNKLIMPPLFISKVTIKSQDLDQMFMTLKLPNM